MFKNISLQGFVRVVLSALALLVPKLSLAAGLTVPCLPGQACDGSKTISGMITLVIGWMLSLAGLIAVLFLIVGGFWYITSAGNEEQAEKGKATVINAIIGIVIIVLSWVIVNMVSNAVATQSPNI